MHMTLATARKVTKKLVSWAAGVGAYKITTQIIDNNVDTEEEGRLDKAAIHLGSAAIGGIVSESVSSYTDPKVDWVFDTIESVKFVSSKATP